MVRRAVFQRFIYALALYLLTPFALYRLTARGIKYHGYFARWRERFGFFPDPRIEGSIWVHAVSLGEVNAALPLIEALMRRYADSRFVITTFTPTGSERVKHLLGDRVFHVYVPYDLTSAVKRFLDRVKPRLAVVMETEIWPNLFITCAERRIPIVIANARLSERSLRGYWPIQPLARRAIRCASMVAAQSTSDYERLIALGAEPEHVIIAGNLKFDIAIPEGVDTRGAAFREAAGRERPVWIAASTHEGEEMAVLKAHAEVLRRFPDALLLIAPRHPERFRPVEHAVRSLGFVAGSYGADAMPAPAQQVFVIDAMGRLMPFYAAAGLAFVGGSLAPIGGHNVLEPAALGTPVLVGPHTFNFAEITASLIEQGGAQRVPDGAALGAAVLELLRDDARRGAMGRAAQQVFERERGATGRLLQLIDARLRA